MEDVQVGMLAKQVPVPERNGSGEHDPHPYFHPYFYHTLFFKKWIMI